ncbi:hypothetical protein GpartN1_g5722.t1 [Galdieria partita]|uniref:Protein kinase domain-containing protein n=1 Tax=Galdieria partita TaxID=83374 RepID=A0A9C7USE0_9RHOD|nr:hypothetical protein GpartN1_g5722.t1 [Galdieria partita]
MDDDGKCRKRNYTTMDQNRIYKRPRENHKEREQTKCNGKECQKEDISKHLTNDERNKESHKVLQNSSPLVQVKHLPVLTGCRSVDNYERLNFIEEGTYGRVFRGRDIHTNEIYALKEIKLDNEVEGFPLTSLREVSILVSLRHPNVIHVREVVVGSSLNKIYLVMEYAQHDMKNVLDNMRHPFSQAEVKSLLQQLLSGVAYLHDNWVLHRDLKTSNLLLNSEGILKICDFGLARLYSDPLKPYTQPVVTLWYRAPELLLGARTYTPAVDIWSVGCIFAEWLTREALFPGSTEIDQLSRIWKCLGTPNEEIWPGLSELPHASKIKFVKQPYNCLRQRFDNTIYGGQTSITNLGLDLMNKLLTYDPEKRIQAQDALNHPYFEEIPKPIDPSLMQTFPETHPNMTSY